MHTALRLFTPQKGHIFNIGWIMKHVVQNITNQIVLYLETKIFMPGHSPVSWGSGHITIGRKLMDLRKENVVDFSGKEKKGLLPEKDDGREKCGHNGRDLSAAPVRSAVEVLIRTAEVFNAVLLDRIERLTKEDIERYRARLRPLLEWKGSFPKRSPFVKAKGIGITQGPRRIHHP